MNLRSVHLSLCFALSSFEGNIHIKWGRSSAGRAPALQAGGQEFDSPRLHHFFKKVIPSKAKVLRRARNEGESKGVVLKRTSTAGFD